MPPNDKIAANNAVSKENFHTPFCIYCGFPHCWKHGTYWRKWFYRPKRFHPHGSEPVQRYRCRCPSCNRTFSEPPQDVLPYCHFYLDDLLGIAGDLEAGKTCYRIAKSGWGISLRVVLRAVLLIRKATPWLEGLCREVAGSIVPGFQALVTTIREKVVWRDFSLRWFHALYPCRARNIYNPHNVVIKRL